MPILRTYHTDPEGVLSFREAWFDEEQEQFVLNRGQVGQIAETPIVEDEVTAEAGASLLEAFAQQCEDDGYAELEVEEQYWMYLRFPLKTTDGSARDRSLRDALLGGLTGHLAWRGLGTVEGASFGPSRLTITVLTPAPKQAIKATISCVRDFAKSDLTKAVIAIAPGADPADAHIKHPAPSRDAFPVDAPQDSDEA